MSQLSDRERDRLLQRKRERREELKRKKLEEQGQAEKYRSKRLLHIKKSNLLLSGKRKPRYVHVPPRYKAEITFPKVFSFIDDPEGTLSFFNKFMARLSKRDIKGLHFNHSGCATLGLDALTLTDALLMEETERRGRQGITVGGTFPTDLRLKIMFKAIGTLRMMQHPEMELEPEIEDQVERSDLYGGNAKGLRKSQDRDKAATSLVEYLDRVLRHQDHSLTPEGHRYFGELISEVIGNAEEHSGRWYTRAFSQPGVLENGQQLEQCHLVIINFGKTIFESLSARGSSHEVRKRIDALVEHHTRKRFFQPKWDEECLWPFTRCNRGLVGMRTPEKALPGEMERSE